VFLNYGTRTVASRAGSGELTVPAGEVLIERTAGGEELVIAVGPQPEHRMIAAVVIPAVIGSAVAVVLLMALVELLGHFDDRRASPLALLGAGVITALVPIVGVACVALVLDLVSMHNARWRTVVLTVTPRELILPFPDSRPRPEPIARTWIAGVGVTRYSTLVRRRVVAGLQIDLKPRGSIVILRGRDEAILERVAAAVRAALNGGRPSHAPEQEVT
jgi:hypothetical protein